MSPAELESVLESHGFTVVKARCTVHEVVILCPGCGDASGNRGVNVKTLATNCWRCGKGGGLVRWASGLGIHVDIEETAQQGVEIDEMAAILEALDRQHEVVKPSGYIPEVKLPTGFTRLEDEPDCVHARLIVKMAQRKGLDREDFYRAGAGFTRQSPRWEPFAIFPVFEWGRPVYYQGRTYVDRPGESTKQFPTREECPLSSRYWLYGLDEVAASGGHVILVEAIFNVLSLRKEIARRGLTGIVPVAVFKHKLSSHQLTKLQKVSQRARLGGHPVASWSVMYDGRTRGEVERGDKGDALQSAYGDAAQLYDEITPVSVVELPDRVDPNDDPVTALDCFLAREPYQPLSL